MRSFVLAADRRRHPCRRVCAEVHGAGDAGRRRRARARRTAAAPAPATAAPAAAHARVASAGSRRSAGRCGRRGRSGGRTRRGWTWTRQSAAAAEAASGRDARAGHADRVGDDAEPGSARGPVARPVGRRPGRVEPEAGVHHAAVGEVPRRHQLRSRLHRQVHHPGQLQRLPGLRHLESREAGAGADVCLPGVAERRLGLQEPAVRVGRRADRPRRLRHSGRARAGQQGSPARHPDLRHHGHRQPEVRRPTCRPAAARTPTPWSPIRTTRRTSTSMCPARPACGRPTSCPAARTARSTIRTPRGSASR